MAYPMPLLEPVTTATFLVSLIFWLILPLVLENVVAKIFLSKKIKIPFILIRYYAISVYLKRDFVLTAKTKHKISKLQIYYETFLCLNFLYALRALQQSHLEY